MLVSSNTFRHPALLLKEAVTVDHVSGGRLILGFGTGWHEDEHRRYGIPLPPAAERVDRFEEALEVLDQLQAGGPVRSAAASTHSTMHSSSHRRSSGRGSAAHRGAPAADAGDRGAPRRPVGHVPVAARDGNRRRRRRHRGAGGAGRCCRPGAGRDPRSVRRSLWAGAEATRSVGAFEEFVRRHRALGFTDFSITRPEPGDENVLREIAQDAIPVLRAELVSP